jgi:hypothetical protein
VEGHNVAFDAAAAADRGGYAALAATYTQGKVSMMLSDDEDKGAVSKADEGSGSAL